MHGKQIYWQIGSAQCFSFASKIVAPSTLRKRLEEERKLGRYDIEIVHVF